MTAQIPDSCVFEGRRWVVPDGEIDEGVLPTNEDLGIETVTDSTANWSGRIDHFIVHEERLFLFKIEVNLAEASRGVLPKGARREIVLRYEPQEVYDHLGHRTEVTEFRTENLVFDNLPLRFSGTMDLSYPYSDGWERPMTSDNPIEERSARATLSFEDGKLTGCRYIEGGTLHRHAVPRTEGPDERTIVRTLSRRIAKKVSRRVVRDLTAMKEAMSGELDTTWEEICVQVQGEHSLFWDAYDLTVQQRLMAQISQLLDHEREALWLQTQPGMEWAFKRDEGSTDSAGADDEDIAEYLKDEYVYAAAGEWSNARIRAFFANRYERD